MLRLAGLVQVTMTGISVETRYLTSRKALAQWSYLANWFIGCDNRAESMGSLPTLLGLVRDGEAESTGYTG